MTSIPLAGLVPLWRTLRQEQVTALITPALDYVGGLEPKPIDIRFAHQEHISAFGEALRSFVGSLDDGCCLHFVYRVDANSAEDVREYENTCAKAQPSPPQAIRRLARGLAPSTAPSPRAPLSLLFLGAGTLVDARRLHHRREEARARHLRFPQTGKLRISWSRSTDRRCSRSPEYGVERSISG